MEEILPFVERAFVSGAQYDTEFSGRPARAIGFSLDATISGSPATALDDDYYRLLGTNLEVVQAGDPIVRMNPRDWRQLAAIISGGFDPYVGGVTGTAKQATALLDFERLMPGSLVNAAGSKVFLRGTYGTAADLASTPPTIDAATFRPFALASSRDPSQGFRRPKIWQATVSLASSSNDIQFKQDLEQDLLLTGVMMRVIDASAAGRRVDGLIRRVRTEVTIGGSGSRQITDNRWSALRLYTCHGAGFGESDVTNSLGVAMQPLRDPRFPTAGQAFFFRAGDSITLHFDTSSTVEGAYGAVTPAAGDEVVLTFVGFSIVSGSGDAGARSEVRTVSASRVAPARNARRRRR
jgi:hypothetical protein